METIIVKADINNKETNRSDICISDRAKADMSASDISKSEPPMSLAGRIIREGGLVAFPTETVYGLGGNALDKEAAAKIYSAKGRPSDNPLIVHISRVEQVEDIAVNISDKARRLMDKFWPGPLTIILEKGKAVPYETTGGLDTVAVRMPNHPVALKLIEEAGVPIAAPSANTSGRPSPTLAAHVAEDMNGRIDMIIDGGQVGIGIESTIIDMSSDVPVILRPGYITREMLEDIIGHVEVDKVVVAKSIEEIGGDYKPKAPGMKYRHYAPKAELTMYEGTVENVAKAINKKVEEAVKNGKKPAVICTDETKALYKNGCIKSIGARNNQETIAYNLYQLLREFDDMDVDCIYGETFYGTGLGQAIMNRLIKAAGYHLEQV